MTCGVPTELTCATPEVVSIYDSKKKSSFLLQNWPLSSLDVLFNQFIQHPTPNQIVTVPSSSLPIGPETNLSLSQLENVSTLTTQISRPLPSPRCFFCDCSHSLHRPPYRQCDPRAAEHEPEAGHAQLYLRVWPGEAGTAHHVRRKLRHRLCKGCVYGLLLNSDVIVKLEGLGVWLGLVV